MTNPLALLPVIEWPVLPLFGVLRYVRHRLRDAMPAALQPGNGPGWCLSNCTLCQHPFATGPSLDPLLQRCLHIAKLPPESVEESRWQRMRIWVQIAKECEQGRRAWRQSLPSHAANLYRKSGFNGPLFKVMYDCTRRLGYTDPHVDSRVARQPFRNRVT